MIFTIDSDGLAIGIELDTEHEDLDLTEFGLGDQLLEIAEREQLSAARREQAPDGTPWAPLAAATVAAKGHAAIGWRTGRMLDLLAHGDRDIQPRVAIWRFPADPGSVSFGKAHGFHNGRDQNQQPARPLIGWTYQAQYECRRVVEEYDLSLKG